jgi:hypothetical protein
LNKQAGAIFPAGAPPRQVPLPTDRAGRIPESESGDPWRRHEGVFSGPQRYMLSRYLETEARRQGINPTVVETAWNEFRKTKAQELYPTVQNSNIALRAYEKGYSEDERNAMELPWLDEFSKTNTIGMPDLDVVRESEAKAAKAYEQTYPKIIASKIGQENADFAVDAAKRGLVAVKDPQTIIDEWDRVDDSYKSRLRDIRRAAGKPEEGLMQQELDVLDTQIQDVSMQLESINNARLDMEQQWSNRNEPPPEGYIELRAKEQKLAADKKGLMKKAALMRAAPAVEGLHDLSMMDTATPEELRNRIDEDRIQFHPYLADKLDPITGRPITEEVPRKATEDDIDAEIEGFSGDAEMIKSIAKRLGVKGRARVAMLADPINNSALREDTRNFLDGHEDWGGEPMLSDTVPVLMTPKDTKIYIPELSHLHSTGVPQTAKEWANDIAARNTNKSYEQYFLAKAEGYKKVRDDKEKVEEQRAKLTNDLLMSYAAAAPADQTFGNYVAVEFNNSMSEAELGLGLSPDTKYLNHCVAQAGRDGGKYIPIYDLATRQHNDGITGPVSNEMREIINSGAIVTSIRDRNTGIPVATIKFTKAKDGKYDLNYVSGLENGKIDPKAATAIRDFLNSSSTKLINPGERVIDNAGVYDLKAADHRQEAARNAGMKEQDINDYLALHPETTRYVTKDDVRAMKPQSVAVATRPAAPSEPILDRIAGVREPAPTDFFDAHEIATTDTSTIPQLNAVLDDLYSNSTTHGHWAETLDEDEQYDLYSSARSNLENQVGQMVREALRNPNATAERLTFLRNELENPTHTGPLRHVLTGNFDDVVQEIDNEIAHLNARANTPAIANAPAFQPLFTVSDADITNYINNMEDIDIAQHLTDWAREQGIAAPDDWATDHFNDMTPDEYGTIPSLRETVRAQLENEQLANAPAPRTAGDIADIANLPDNFEEVGDATTPTSALVANQIAQGQRGGAGNLNHVIDQLSDPASAGPLLAQLTPDEVDEMLSAASYHLESHVSDAVENSITNPNRTREGLLRLADNLEDPPAEGPLRNISSTGFIDDIARLRAEAANLPVVGDWEPEPPMTLPAPAQVAPAPEFGGTNYTQMRTMIENATPETIIDVGRQLSGNQGDYGLVEFGDLTDLWVNRNTQLRNAPEAEPPLMGLPIHSMETALAHIRDALTPMTELRELQQQVEHPTHDGTHWVGNASRGQLDTLRRALRYELAERMPAERITAESIMLAPDLDALQRMADAIHDNRPEYTNEQVRTLERLMRTRATEIANAGGAGFAHGGVVHMEKGGLNIRPSGSYNDYKDQYVKVKRSTTGIDIDLLDKYGIGATKQKLNVTLPEGKIKQSDISELRARYKTDSGDQYNISYSPLEKRASLSKPNPKDQSEWRADFSPEYKGISYNRNFAQGGAVYDEQHVSKIANELLGAMNG